MIMAAADLLQRNPNPSEEEVRHGLEGNLCRCTGYHNIVKAVLDAARAPDTETVAPPPPPKPEAREEIGKGVGAGAPSRQTRPPGTAMWASRCGARRTRR